MINNIKKIEKLPLIRTEAVLIIGALHDAIKHDEKLDWYRTQQNELNTMRDLIDEIIELFPNIDRDIVVWRQSTVADNNE
jgi:hypothetical protein|tara:strand:+ start:237 stop:476 length:240 start_codon:yes stop_codon:yes gene_type:complete